MDTYNEKYFYNLRENFGNNVKGSCFYVAFSMLLSYYDSYWNDNMIPESYDKVSYGIPSNTSLTSPGINCVYFDTFEDEIIKNPEFMQDIYNDLGTQDSVVISNRIYLEYICENYTTDFHLYLLELAIDNNLFSLNYNTNSSPIGITYSSAKQFLEQYILNYLDSYGISINYYDSDVESNVRNNIVNGIPTIVFKRNTSENAGHVMIAYSVNESNQIVYHNGNDNTCSLETEYNQFDGAISIDITSQHSCSDNYKISSDDLGHCRCWTENCSEHVCEYDYSYTIYNSNKHKANCYCLNYKLQMHNFNENLNINECICGMTRS